MAGSLNDILENSGFQRLQKIQDISAGDMISVPHPLFLDSLMIIHTSRKRKKRQNIEISYHRGAVLTFRELNGRFMLSAEQFKIWADEVLQIIDKSDLEKGIYRIGDRFKDYLSDEISRYGLGKWHTKSHDIPPPPERKREMNSSHFLYL